MPDDSVGFGPPPEEVTPPAEEPRKSESLALAALPSWLFTTIARARNEEFGGRTTRVSPAEISASAGP